MEKTYNEKLQKAYIKLMAASRAIKKLDKTIILLMPGDFVMNGAFEELEKLLLVAYASLMETRKEFEIAEIVEKKEKEATAHLV